VHAGTSSPEDWADGCIPAARAGRDALLGGAAALEAAAAAVRVLEDDGRFNAGRGSVLRLDGKTIETDAGVMDSDGRIGAVAALRGFRHPVDAACAVLGTPHVLLVAEGAARYADTRGLERRDGPPEPETLARHERAMKMLRERTSKRPEWRDADLAALWNFDGPLPPELTPNDTVGAVARDAEGRMASANSTGGAVPMLLGRVGDSPIPGAGFWAGPSGAVATTGMGEEIIRRMAAREVYLRMESGAVPQEALDEVVALFPKHVSYGAIAVDRDGFGMAANRTMAWAYAE